MKFKIFAGLGGGFGGASYEGTFDYSNEQEAYDDAYSRAIECYGSYEGMHGLRSIEDIMDEDGVDEEEAEEIYSEERESWLDYWVEQVDSDSEESEEYDD